MIRKLDIEEAKKLYRDYIDEDFPNDERPNYNHYVKLLSFCFLLHMNMV